MSDKKRILTAAGFAAMGVLVMTPASRAAETLIANFENNTLQGLQGWDSSSLTLATNPTGGTGNWAKVTAWQWWGRTPIPNWANSAINTANFNAHDEVRFDLIFPDDLGANSWVATNASVGVRLENQASPANENGIVNIVVDSSTKNTVVPVSVPISSLLPRNASASWSTLFVEVMPQNYGGGDGQTWYIDNIRFASALAENDGSWDVTKEGNYTEPTNWIAGVVGNGGGKIATFGAPAAPRAINMNAGVSLGGMVLDGAGANSYTFNGAAGFSFGTGATLTVNSGDHVVNAPATLATSNATPTVVTVAAGSSLTNAAMTTSGFGAITKAGEGTWNAARISNVSLTVQGGTVNLGTQAGGAENWIYGITTAAGATLNAGNNNVLANTISGNGTVTTGAGGSITSAGYSGNYAYFGSIGGAGNLHIGNASETVGTAHTATFSGPLAHTGATTVQDGATMVLGTNLTTSSSLEINTGTVQLEANGARVIKTPSLVVVNGTVDLTNNKLIVAGAGSAGSFDTATGLYSGVNQLAQSGRNGGTWDGLGIVTSETHADTGLTAVAVALASETPYAGGTFAGQNVAANDVLVMYTYGGDADLNGAIDSDDYFAIDSNFNLSGSVFGWTKGDFDYNGAIDSDDYFIIDSNFNNQILGQFPGSTGAADAVTAVPEPASACVIALAGAGLLARRRRN